jgi:hypothetical protein
LGDAQGPDRCHLYDGLAKDTPARKGRKWPFGFVAVHALVMVLHGFVGGALGAAWLPNMAGHPLIIAAALFMAGAPALAGIATGLVAVIARGARLALVIGPLLLVVLFLLAEVLVPH